MPAAMAADPSLTAKSTSVADEQHRTVAHAAQSAAIECF
jgi:hypothetical protein